MWVRDHDDPSIIPSPSIMIPYMMSPSQLHTQRTVGPWQKLSLGNL